MEQLNYRFTRAKRRTSRAAALVGVVASGNLEVLVERVLPGNECEIDIRTAAVGFGAVWQAVVADFVERRTPGGLKLSINDDGGARADMVSLRLAQAVRAIEGTHDERRDPRYARYADTPAFVANAASWYEASARQRIDGLLDAGSFREFLGPAERVTPAPAAVRPAAAVRRRMVVGHGRLSGQPVFVAAQEGRFMGGAFGDTARSSPGCCEPRATPASRC